MRIYQDNEEIYVYSYRNDTLSNAFGRKFFEKIGLPNENKFCTLNNFESSHVNSSHIWCCVQYCHTIIFKRSSWQSSLHKDRHYVQYMIESYSCWIINSYIFVEYLSIQHYAINKSLNLLLNNSIYCYRTNSFSPIIFIIFE